MSMDGENIEFMGFKDGGKYHIVCDKCSKDGDKTLLTIISVKPQDEFDVKSVSAICPFCNRKTKESIISGKFYIMLGKDGEIDGGITSYEPTEIDKTHIVFNLE